MTARASCRSKKAKPNAKKCTIPRTDDDDDDNYDASFEISQSVYEARFEALQQQDQELSGKKTIEQQKQITELSTQMSFVATWFAKCGIHLNNIQWLLWISLLQLDVRPLSL